MADRRKKNVFANLENKYLLMSLARNGAPRPGHDPEFTKFIKRLKPRWFANGDSSLELVIQRILNSANNPGNPAYKAHATRALRSYSERRAAEIGSTPKHVAAGVRAAVTKRIKTQCSKK